MTDLLYYAFLAIVLYFLLKRLILEHIYLSYRGKYVFITGCDTGFGRRLAIKLLQLGVNVFAGCYTTKGRESLEQECKENHELLGELHTIRVDVTCYKSVEQARQTVEELLKKKETLLWSIVNNAGIFSTFGPDDWCTMREYELSINVNTMGAIRVCHEFKPLLKQSQGRIITMGSTAGRLHGRYVTPYVTAKFALEAYMDCLRLELRPYNIGVHILEPGAFKTELLNEHAHKARIDTIWSNLPEKTKLEYGEEYKRNFEIAWQMGLNFIANPNLDWVVDTYTHALFSWWPRLRYSPGWDAMFIFVPISILPTGLQDNILSLMYSLQPGPKLQPDFLEKKPSNSQSMHLLNRLLHVFILSFSLLSVWKSSESRRDSTAQSNQTN
ncbi:hypothetical protein WR25_03551 [Diploscapter pachys]|uniref:Uncharacterized protein n=1 Tax=Diploscapter pachys TaxID=2018661 RepID=A0A2A2K4V4_9BILA|nr:hypothetical protein WR25_03551 [Diploscapter pachys]